MHDDADATFSGAVPDHYDRGLGPVIFADYATDIARRAALSPPARVLEIAAGTGIVTRELRDRLPDSTHLTATDLNPPMLDVARAKFRAGEQVHFQPADATALPFADGEFDAVVCQFGVMFFPDKNQAFREVRRVLAPKGRYLFSVWDSRAHNPFSRIAHDTIARFFPADPPQFYDVPFGYHLIDPAKEALLDAGFTQLHVSVLRLETRVANVELFARGLVHGSPVIEQLRSRGMVDANPVSDALARELRSELGIDDRPLQMQGIVFDVA